MQRPAAVSEPIHVRFQQPATGPEFHYRVRHVLAVSDDVIVTHIARLAISPDGEPPPPSFNPDQPFYEMAMYVTPCEKAEPFLQTAE
jgi:hypothetical protein